jgi:formate/nitrite transporter FocA (FNT family)
MEDALERAFDRTISEGEQRLGRPWHALLSTGFLGGTEIAIGVLAFVAVLAATGSQLLAGLAFSIGFIALLLGRSELFTEGFLVPVTTVVAKKATPGRLLTFWAGTLVANLAGGWVMMWLVVAAYPDLHAQLVESAGHFALAPLSSQTVALALLAGAVITLMTRMQHGTDSMPAKIAAAIAGAFLLVGLEMFHSILDSLLIFGALHTGEAPFGYLDWLGWLWWTVLANMLGGLLIITLLRLIRSKDRLEYERRQR